MTRNGRDYSSKFPEIVRDLRRIGTRQSVLDGEVAVTDEEGKTDFQRLQNHLLDGSFASPQFNVFDLLVHNGEDIRELPLAARKSRLDAVCAKLKGKSVVYCKHLDGSGEAIFATACELGLEGLVSKKRSSPYRGRRTVDWLKVKCIKRQEFVTAGFTESTNQSYGFGALLLGYYTQDGELQYAGKVGTGFTIKSRQELLKKLKLLTTSSCPLTKNISGEARRRTTWVRPTLVAEIAFTEWTSEKRCRHPAFKGLRDDKPASKISRELGVTRGKEESGSNSSAASGNRRDGSIEIGGVTITHPDRPITTGSAVTKRLLAQYFLDAQAQILPWYRDRPLVLVRCPGGGKDSCFYQKHANDSFQSSAPLCSP